MTPTRVSCDVDRKVGARSRAEVIAKEIADMGCKFCNARQDEASQMMQLYSITYLRRFASWQFSAWQETASWLEQR
jgi:hypothetical protein